MKFSSTSRNEKLSVVPDHMAPLEFAIRAILDGLDHLAGEMERKWGVGRLRLLVSDMLRARFDAQKDKLDAAIETDREPYVRVQAEGMKRAWAALDAAAIEAGAEPLSPEVWECKLPSSGEVVSVVRTEAEAQLLTRSATPPSPTSTGATMTTPLARRSRRRRARADDADSCVM